MSSSTKLTQNGSTRSFAFPEQLNIPIPTLNSIARQERKTSRSCKGIIYVHFIDNPEFELEFFENESIKSLRERIARYAKADLTNYNVVCKNGTMSLNRTTTEYGLQPNSHIVVLENQAHKTQHSKTRDSWIECRKRRSLGSLDIDTRFLQRIGTKNNIKLQKEEKEKDMQVYKSVETFFNEINRDMF